MRLWACASRPARVIWLGCVCLAGFVCAAASAQTLRDPTLPPPAAASVAPRDGNKAVVVQSGAVAVVVRAGVPYVVVGTRLYAKGQLIGQARIERITETEVWLREEGALRKVSLFGGIERHASTAKDAVNHQSKTVREAVRSQP